MYIFLFILTLLFSPFIIHAQDFTPYQNNPVITNKSGGLYQPFVLKEQSGFTAYLGDGLSGRAVISQMKSANGIDWYDKKYLTVSNRQHVHDPFVLKSNNQYELYFGSSDNNFASISIWKSISADGSTFSPGAEKEILHAEKPWEGSSISAPSVIEDNGLSYVLYAGNGNGWAIGMATSSDRDTWQRCSNNPIILNGSSPSIVKYNNVFYLFFHTTTNLQVQETNSLNGCNTVWTNKRTVSLPFIDPAPVVVGSDIWLYGTTYTSSGSVIFLGGTNTIPSPSYPIVIIPGMFASWNGPAILHNTSVSYDAWKLNQNVTEYNALIETLQNKGRILNQDLFIYPYDWRNPISSTVDNLHTFLMNKVWNNSPYQPVQLIGHSLGGVVNRVFADKFSLLPVKNSVSVGAPHLGLVQSYKPLSGGEVVRENTLMWLAQKLVLMLNKSSLQSDKETISQKLPVLFDLLPSFPFLKSETGTPIVSTLTNALYAQFPMQQSPAVSQLSIGATGRQTSAGYILGAKTSLDSLFGTYADGHPISSWTEDGDGAILLKSSLNQVTPAPTQDHREIIYSKNNIKSILSALSIQALDSEIPLGKSTSIFPAILTFIQSPGTMQIVHNGITKDEDDGMIHLQSTENGMYSLKVTGESTGEYTVSIWLIGENDDKWIQFKKQTSSGKVDEYSIFFDSTNGGTAFEFVPPTPTLRPSPTLTPSPTRIPTSVLSPTKVCTPKPTITITKPPVKYSNHQLQKIIKNFINRLFHYFERKK